MSLDSVFQRKSLSPSCFNKEEEEGEEEEAFWYQPKLVELRKFLVPLLILRYIESLHFSTTFGNLLPAVQHLPCRDLYSSHWICRVTVRAEHILFLVWALLNSILKQTHRC